MSWGSEFEIGNQSVQGPPVRTGVRRCGVGGVCREGWTRNPVGAIVARALMAAPFRGRRRTDCRGWSERRYGGSGLSDLVETGDPGNGAVHLAERRIRRRRRLREQVFSREESQGETPSPLGSLPWRGRGFEGAGGMARVAAPHVRPSAVRLGIPPGLGKTSRCQSHRHSSGVPTAWSGDEGQSAGPNDRRLRTVASELRRDAARRRSLIAIH